MANDTRHRDADLRLRVLLDQHYRAVLAYAARRTVPPGDVHVAQDVAAVVFSAAWQRLDDLPGEALPWLLATARNVLSGYQRAERRRAGREVRSATDRALAARGTGDPATSVTDTVTVREALARLSPADRELATLIAWDDLSLTEAAQSLSISPEAARTRWKRLKTRLAALLAERPETPAEVATRLEPARRNAGIPPMEVRP